MSDKSKLINSMQHLINHISASTKNQQQIFSTLSMGDLTKIIANIEDSNQKLRKITLVLLAELLYENAGLQKIFCQFIGIPQSYGKIVLSYNWPKAILTDANSLNQVYKLIKKKQVPKQRGLFWYIDSVSKPKTLQIAKRNFYNVDPINCIVGIWLVQQPNPSTQHISRQRTHKQQQNSNQNLKSQRFNRSNHTQRSGRSHHKKPQTPIKSSQTPYPMSQNLRNKNIRTIEFGNAILSPVSEGVSNNNGLISVRNQIHTSRFTPTGVVSPNQSNLSAIKYIKNTQIQNFMNSSHNNNNNNNNHSNGHHHQNITNNESKTINTNTNTITPTTTTTTKNSHPTPSNNYTRPSSSANKKIQPNGTNTNTNINISNSTNVTINLSSKMHTNMGNMGNMTNSKTNSTVHTNNPTTATVTPITRTSYPHENGISLKNSLIHTNRDPITTNNTNKPTNGINPTTKVTSPASSYSRRQRQYQNK